MVYADDINVSGESDNTIKTHRHLLSSKYGDWSGSKCWIKEIYGHVSKPAYSTK